MTEKTTTQIPNLAYKLTLAFRVEKRKRKIFSRTVLKDINVLWSSGSVYQEKKGLLKWQRRSFGELRARAGRTTNHNLVTNWP